MNEFNIGDEVTWTRVVEKGCSVRIFTARGKITKFDNAGQTPRAFVKLRNGRLWSVPLSKLRSEKRQSELGEGMEKFLKVVVEEKLIP